MNLRALSVLVALTVMSVAGCNRSAEKPVPPPRPVLATIETDKGVMELELFPALAPKTVENFRLLAERGYYNGLMFHRVVKGFMIQGGDPKGDGSGGESAWGGQFEDEINKSLPIYQGGYKRGTIAMANAGPNTNTSQFFIIHQDYPLNPGYTIFGKVTKGLEVVDAIAEVPTAATALSSERSRPVTPVRMTKVTVQVGAEAPTKN